MAIPTATQVSGGNILKWRGVQIFMCCFALVLAALGVASTSGAFEDLHRKELATNPADLHFALSSSNGQKRFHPGETIPITLEFSSDTSDKYKLDAGSYDRSGRLWSEEFSIDRNDAVDPLADYFGSGVISTIGGGMRSMPVLSSQAVRIRLTLNDWFRFDNPGRYRLFLKSNRLRRERLAQEPGDGTIHFAAVSNILEIEISERDAAWEAAQAADLARVLDAPRGTEAGAGEEAVSKAQRALEDLGSAEAVRLMFARARQNSQSLPSLALIRSPQRAAVIMELDRYLGDPSVGFDGWPLSLRALFDYVKRYPQPLVPLTPAGLRAFDVQTVQAELEKRRREFEEMKRLVAVRLIPVIARKDATVREQCVRAIAEAAPAEAKAGGLVEPDDYGMTRAQLIEGFSGFSQERQLALLSEEWNLVRGHEMIPALRLAIEHAPHESAPPILAGKVAWTGPGDVAEFALYRLRELAPDEEKRILLEDITQAKPRFADAAVRELPSQDIAKADEALASNLKSDPMTALSTVPLAAKFGTRRLMQPMLALYKGPEGPCMMDEWFVAYFVRADAEKGTRILREAMGARENRGCFQSLLSSVAAITWNGVVEEQAIKTLNDSDSEAASNAVATLAGYGGKEVQSALLRRLEQWSERWRGRAAALKGNAITGADPSGGDGALGYSLFRSIGAAKAWVVDERLAQRLASLCVEEACREEWGKYKIGSVQIQNATGMYGYGRMFRVGSAGFEEVRGVEERMAQHPVGTVFQWCPKEMPDAFDARALDSAGKEIEQFAAKHGMQMEACRKGENN